MKFLTRFIVILALLAVGGVVAFLAAWDMPPPTQRVEKVIGDDALGG
mgnify:CR=1 FL=1